MPESRHQLQSGSKLLFILFVLAGLGIANHLFAQTNPFPLAVEIDGVPLNITLSDEWDPDATDFGACLNIGANSPISTETFTGCGTLTFTSSGGIRTWKLVLPLAEVNFDPSTMPLENLSLVVTFINATNLGVAPDERMLGADLSYWRDGSGNWTFLFGLAGDLILAEQPNKETITTTLQLGRTNKGDNVLVGSVKAGDLLTLGNPGADDLYFTADGLIVAYNLSQGRLMNRLGGPAPQPITGADAYENDDVSARPITMGAIERHNFHFRADSDNVTLQPRQNILTRIEISQYDSTQIMPEIAIGSTISPTFGISCRQSGAGMDCEALPRIDNPPFLCAGLLTETAVLCSTNLPHDTWRVSITNGRSPNSGGDTSYTLKISEPAAPLTVALEGTFHIKEDALGIERDIGARLQGTLGGDWLLKATLDPAIGVGNSVEVDCVETGADGRFRFSNVEAGSYFIEAAHEWEQPDWMISPDYAEVANGVTAVNGTVTEGDAAVAGERVCISRQEALAGAGLTGIKLTWNPTPIQPADVVNGTNGIRQYLPTAMPNELRLEGWLGFTLGGSRANRTTFKTDLSLIFRKQPGQRPTISGVISPDWGDICLEGVCLTVVDMAMTAKPLASATIAAKNRRLFARAPSPAQAAFDDLEITGTAELAFPTTFPEVGGRRFQAAFTLGQVLNLTLLPAEGASDFGAFDWGDQSAGVRGRLQQIGASYSRSQSAFQVTATGDLGLTLFGADLVDWRDVALSLGSTISAEMAVSSLSLNLPDEIGINAALDHLSLNYEPSNLTLTMTGQADIDNVLGQAEDLDITLQRHKGRTRMAISTPDAFTLLGGALAVSEMGLEDIGGVQLFRLSGSLALPDNPVLGLNVNVEDMLVMLRPFPMLFFGEDENGIVSGGFSGSASLLGFAAGIENLQFPFPTGAFAADLAACEDNPPQVRMGLDDLWLGTSNPLFRQVIAGINGATFDGGVAKLHTGRLETPSLAMPCLGSDPFAPQNLPGTFARLIFAIAGEHEGAGTLNLGGLALEGGYFIKPEGLGIWTDLNIDSDVLSLNTRLEGKLGPDHFKLGAVGSLSFFSFPVADAHLKVDSAADFFLDAAVSVMIPLPDQSNRVEFSGHIKVNHALLVTSASLEAKAKFNLLGFPIQLGAGFAYADGRLDLSVFLPLVVIRGQIDISGNVAVWIEGDETIKEIGQTIEEVAGLVAQTTVDAAGHVVAFISDAGEFIVNIVVDVGETIGQGFKKAWDCTLGSLFFGATCGEPPAPPPPPPPPPVWPLQENGRPGLTNLAQFYTSVTLSSGTDAWRAVDGNTQGHLDGHSVTFTQNESQPWLEIDLGAVQDIYIIDVWERSDCCGLTDFVVLVSENPFPSSSLNEMMADPTISHFLKQGEITRKTSLQFNLPGRFVRVQLAGEGTLNLAEVQIWGTVPQHQAQWKTAVQSSNPDLAARAVDGRAYASPAFATFTETRLETQPWWEVDLGAEYDISTIDLWALRRKCEPCPDLHVLLSSTPIDGIFLEESPSRSGVSEFMITAQSAQKVHLAIDQIGRYLRIQSPGFEQFSVAEVQVWGNRVDENTPRPGRIYRIHPGDSLWGIARAVLGPEAAIEAIKRYSQDIYRVNRLVVGGNPDLIFAGNLLDLP